MNSERRQSLRFETCVLVRVQSTEHGITHCVARDVSAGGIFLEMREPLPLGAAVRVWFENPGEDGASISAVGEVKNHYFLQYGDADTQTPRSLTGMGVRFVKFEEPCDDTLPVRSYRQDATLH